MGQSRALAALFVFAILTLWVPDYWPVTVFQVGVFALAAVTVWRTRRSNLPFSWPLIPLSVAIVWGLLQWLAGWTAYAFETRLAILKWATFLSVYLTGISMFRDDSVRRWFRSAMLWFGFLVSVLATVQSFTSQGKVFWLFATPYTDFVMGPMLSRNDFAAFLEVVLPIALFEAMRRERDVLLYSGMAAAMYASVIASASRAGSILATAEMVLVPLLWWGRNRASGRAAGAAVLRMGVLAAVLACVVGVGSLWSRFQAPDPLAGRREFAVSSWQMAASHPWLGVGLGAWPTVYPAYATIDLEARVNQALDDWLQWTAEGGFPFGILVATLFFWSLRPAFRTVWGLGVVAVFLHALVDYPFARPTLGSWPIVMMAMMAVGEIKEEETEGSKNWAALHLARRAVPDRGDS